MEALDDALNDPTIAPDADRSTLSEEDTLIPLRMVEAMTYCPRQAWYRFVAGDDPLNIQMERGLRRHATMDDAPLPTLAPDVRVYRHLAVVAPLLGVTGVLDEVMIDGETLTITEYKTTKLRGPVWEGTAMQLAVQHLALREHAARAEWHGPPMPSATLLRVYLAESRRYRDVPWTPALETDAREAITRCRAILSMRLPPAGIVGARCRHCQHEPICLPEIVPKLSTLPLMEDDE